MSMFCWENYVGVQECIEREWIQYSLRARFSDAGFALFIIVKMWIGTEQKFDGVAEIWKDKRSRV